MPHLAEFQRRYPEVQLELFTEDRFSDLVLGSFDAGIRMHAMLQKDMIAVPIDNGQRRVLVASPDYLTRCGAPATRTICSRTIACATVFPAAANWSPGISVGTAMSGRWTSAAV